MRPLALSCALFLAACTTMGPEREASIGSSAAREVEQQMGLVEDPRLVAYIEKLGARIAQHSPRQDVPYRFHVVDMEVPNAFALPGGYIYVSRGLLALTNSEAELAGVLGHEIGHVAEKHAAERESRAFGAGVFSTLVRMLGAVFGGAPGAGVASDLGQLAAAGHVASYGRDQEREADEVGQQLAAQAGYDPIGMSKFLRRLGAAMRLQTGEAEIPSFLDSHPATYERARTTSWRGNQIEVSSSPPLSATRASYLARLVGLSAGSDPAKGVFMGRRFVHPGMRFAIDLPRGWKTLNQPRGIAAMPENRAAMVTLEFQRGSEDPAAAAKTYSRSRRLTLREGAATSIDRTASYRARANSSDGKTFDLTWIASDGGTWRIAGASRRADFQSHAASFEATARSFRRVTDRELERIRVRQLYIVRARAGESLVELSRRSRNVWSTTETAVWNGLDENARFSGRELVKIVVERPLSMR